MSVGVDLSQARAPQDGDAVEPAAGSFEAEVTVGREVLHVAGRMIETQTCAERDRLRTSN